MNRKLIFRILLVWWCFLGARAQAGAIQTVKPSDLIALIANSKSKLILLNFWATWCPPCRREVPGIIKLRRYYNKEQLSIIGIAMDSSAAMVLDFKQKVKFNYPVYLGEDTVASMFGVQGFPTIIIYNQSGERLYMHEGYLSFFDLNRIVKEFLP
ncbi:MAG: TlpA disulfide reductase family protein [Desulfonauticus sp.]|nr:TlpA disulfide reductase family protein [Desulfonauticus sp.]